MDRTTNGTQVDISVHIKQDGTQLNITGGSIGGLLAQNVDQIRMPIYGMLLVILMLVRPQGLFGTREIWDVLPRWWPGARKGIT